MTRFVSYADKAFEEKNTKYKPLYTMSVQKYWEKPECFLKMGPFWWERFSGLGWKFWSKPQTHTTESPSQEQKITRWWGYSYQTQKIHEDPCSTWFETRISTWIFQILNKISNPRLLGILGSGRRKSGGEGKTWVLFMLLCFFYTYTHTHWTFHHSRIKHFKASTRFWLLWKKKKKWFQEVLLAYPYAQGLAYSPGMSGGFLHFLIVTCVW